ncbi:tetratricopeptide repeat protein [Paraburkholderia phenoliruptrix]|uniref:O-linked N-acetylglucosamine transferase family protein n=1 Tax=Paraburkholderia phenoliruptrix TaxID=252970 RepID=UPI001C6DDCA1|nr:tetratricopeptide repeat protein [Paraburkholderia phenoliruptrix]MBW9107934.1 tetratricopeptide repeat protein [Paraburkholderia phenoliruptrix]MBW9133238.1 tetratricopeptide repeat protein [Paraburkholderia ginsengiterrae]
MSIQFDFSAPQPLSPEQQRAQDIALVMQSAIEQYHKGEIDDARALFEAIIEAVPQHPDANYNLGVIKVQTDLPAEAVPHFEVALGIRPQNGQYWVAYINALFQSDQVAAGWLAVEMAQQQGVNGPALNGLITQLAYPDRKLETTPNASPTDNIKLIVSETSDDTPQPEAAAQPADQQQQQQQPAAPVPLKTTKHRQADKGELHKHNMLVHKGQLAESVAVARKLVARYPKDSECWRALSISLHKNSQFREVIPAARKAIELDPNDVICRLLLSDTLRHTGALAEAETQARELLAIVPEHAEAHRILGVTLIALGKRAEAIASCQRAADLAPRSAAVHSSLGTLYLGIGAMDLAEKALRLSLELEPTNSNARSNLLFCLTHNSTIDKAALFKEHCVFGEIHDVPAAGSRRYPNKRNPDRKLRIGFVSGDFCNHAVAYYFLPIVQHLYRDPSLTLHFYYTFGLQDHMTAQLRECAHVWNAVADMSDAALVKKIRDDNIDIVVDLSGHTAHTRIVALAQKPAPVQASWIGYPGTTGMAAFDYYIADRFVAPIDEFTEQFTEKLALLPSSTAYMPPPNCPPVNGLPALHKGYITYGSFNRLNKLSTEVIALWSTILRAQPTSRMVIGAIGSKLDEETYLEWFRNEGIDTSRLTFCPRTTLPVYMQQHHHVDLCLDTFPYVGSTTTLNALWMGVPTVTMPGTSMPSRCGAGWLEQVGLHDFVARDKDEFVKKSIELTRDLDALSALRIGMRERCLGSVPFHPEKVAGGLSIALRTMWQRWCADETPTPFEATLPADWCPPPAPEAKPAAKATAEAETRAEVKTAA